MTKPTHGQWRGYAVLCVLLVVVFLLLLLLPTRHRENPQMDTLAFRVLIDQYGDSLVKEPHQSPLRYQNYPNRYDPGRVSRTYAAEHKQEWYSPERVVVELNSADTLDLQQLYGIGPAFARRIVKYRQLLGGYVSKEQLLEVYGMDVERYNGFVDQVKLDTSQVGKIAINTVSIDQLKRHPYIDYYQAKSLVQFREQQGPYHGIKDLLKVNLIDSQFITKIEPYIQY